MRRNYKKMRSASWRSRRLSNIRNRRDWKNWEESNSADWSSKCKRTKLMKYSVMEVHSLLMRTEKYLTKRKMMSLLKNHKKKYLSKSLKSQSSNLIGVETAFNQWIWIQIHSFNWKRKSLCLLINFKRKNFLKIKLRNLKN